jgi:transcriptional regulator with XRE-family HTH domain
MKDEVTTRLAQFIEAKGMSIRAFERELGLSVGIITKAIKNGTAFSHQYIWKIALAFPELDMEWLIRGKGIPPIPSNYEDFTPQKDIVIQLKAQMHQIQETLQRLELQGFSA